MAYVQIRYSSSAFDSIIEKVKLSFSYSVEEKNTLHNMLMQMKQENWLLYMVETYEETMFDFKISDYAKMKKYLINEVYGELLKQLLENCKNYEDIEYSEIRDWFYGMSFDIKLINVIDQKFKEIGVIIRY